MEYNAFTMAGPLPEFLTCHHLFHRLLPIGFFLAFHSFAPGYKIILCESEGQGLQRLLLLLSLIHSEMAFEEAATATWKSNDRQHGVNMF